MTLRVLHILDHSLPQHSGYTFRTLAILREQRKLGWETLQLTSPRQGPGSAEFEDIDNWRFHRTSLEGGVGSRVPGLTYVREMRATAAYPTRQDAGQWLGLNLIGAKVVSASSDSVGKIANLVVNENGAVDAAVITVGGFLGIGGRDVAVTYDSLNIVRNHKGDGIDHVVIAATKSDLSQAAKFKSLHRQMAEAQSRRATTPLP